MPRDQQMDRLDIWAKIAAPIPPDEVQWRQQAKAKEFDGTWKAPFVAYIDAQLVRDRLDAIVPGEWDLTLELLPPTADEDGVPQTAFKARLQILGVIREDVGMGKDYKQASTDAFKRAAVRFGVGHELYTDYDHVWVRVNGDSKYAKALEDPATVFATKRGIAQARAADQANTAPSAPASAPAKRAPAKATPKPAPVGDVPSCCGKEMWDNRTTKRSERAPDFKCKTNGDHVIWLGEDGAIKTDRRPEQPAGYDDHAYAKASATVPDDSDFPAPLHDDEDDLPF